MQDAATEYGEGFQDGYARGLKENEMQDDTTGYDGGFKDGYSRGFKTGYATGAKSGVQDGYANGYKDGVENGYSEGHRHGYDVGLVDLEKDYQKGKALAGRVTGDDKEHQRRKKTHRSEAPA